MSNSVAYYIGAGCLAQVLITILIECCMYLELSKMQNNFFLLHPPFKLGIV